MPMLAVWFAAPWIFAGGVAATSVPIIIRILMGVPSPRELRGDRTGVV